MNVRKTITTSALALGVLAGSAGIASAVSSTAQPAPAPIEDQTQDPILNGSVQSPEVEGQSEADESAALESLASITADDASQAALEANPGATVDGVQLENENGSVVYEVDMTDSSGVTIEVKVDAGNGAVLAQESGDDEANEGAESEDETETDGIDHENEGEEIGENGNGIPDADDANEAPEVAPVN